MIGADVFFTWDIHYDCKFKCTYCFLRQEQETARIPARYLPVEEWLRIWGGINERYGRAHISVTGGEPFDYPRFIDLVAALTERNTFEFSTNFSWDAEYFASRIDPRKVRINPSFHPESQKTDAYMKKFLGLRDRHYSMGVVTIVAYPPFLGDIERYKAEFEKQGVGVVIFPYRGIFGDKRYPDAYTPEERKLLRSLGAGIAADINEKIAERHNVDGPPKESNQFKPCAMGMKYGKILPNGDVFRCCAAVWTPEKTWQSWGSLGNIFDKTFAFYTEAQTCKTPLPDDCRCFKAMVSGKEAEWQKYWTGL